MTLENASESDRPVAPPPAAVVIIGVNKSNGDSRVRWGRRKEAKGGGERKTLRPPPDDSTGALRPSPRLNQGPSDILFP